LSRSVAATASVRIGCIVRIDLGSGKGGKSGGGEESRLMISNPDLQIEQYVRVEE
jgi:hypothetical protein